MEIQIHAKRFPDNPNEREKFPFNNSPATIVLDSHQEVRITVVNDVVRMWIDDEEQIAISLAEWDYTAVALVAERVYE